MENPRHTHKPYLIIALISLSLIGIAAVGAMFFRMSEKATSRKYLESKFEIARSYVQQGMAEPGQTQYFENATGQYEEILKNHPDNKDALSELSDVYTHLGKTKEAQDLQDKLKKIAPDYTPRQNIKPISLPAPEAVPSPKDEAAYNKYLDNKLEVARSFLQQAATSPENTQYFEDAIRQYEEVLKIKPDNKEALAELGDIYTRRGNLQEAQKIYKRLAAIDPRYVRPIPAPITKLAEEQKLTPQDEKAYRKLLDEKLNLARSYMQQGFMGSGDAQYFDKAIQQYTQILKFSPENSQATSEMADAYIRLGKFDEAEKLCKKLLRKDPESISYHVKLGFLYNGIGRKDKAMGEANFCASYSPKNSKPHLLRAAIFESSDDLPAAIAEYKIAIKLAESAKSMDQLEQAYAGLGNLYFRAGLFFDSVAQLEKMLKAEPKSLISYLELANKYYRLGLIDKAISTLNTLITLNASIPQAYEMLGSAYFQKGDVEAAYASFRKAQACGSPVTDQLLNVLEEKIKEKKK